MRKLDIIVPHWKEPWEVGEKLFRIIGLQRGIDFGEIRVTVVHDGTEPFAGERFDGLGYEVRQITIPHGGVSAARNAGIEAADAEWLMFCDFDDMFAGVFALRDILTALPGDGFDILWTQMVAENRETIYYTPEIQTWVFTHGKLYRRQFLLDTGIRFNTELTFNEDSEFNARIIARTHYRRTGKLRTQSPVYIWIRRENSVTQSGREDEAAWGHFRRNLSVTAETMIHRGRPEYCGMVTRTVWDTWFMVNGRRVSPGMKRQILERFAPWIRERRDALLSEVPEDILGQIRSVSRRELLDPDEEVRDDPAAVAAWVDMMIRGGNRDGDIDDQHRAD